MRRLGKQYLLQLQMLQPRTLSFPVPPFPSFFLSDTSFRRFFLHFFLPCFPSPSPLPSSLFFSHRIANFADDQVFERYMYFALDSNEFPEFPQYFCRSWASAITNMGGKNLFRYSQHLFGLLVKTMSLEAVKRGYTSTGIFWKFLDFFFF